MRTDIDAVVAETLDRLATLPVSRRWAGCSAIWATLWALAAPAWARWPDAAARVLTAMNLALAQVGGLHPTSSIELALVGLEALDIEDDGSAEFQHALDLASLLLQALPDPDVDQCLEAAIRTYLEGTFNVLVNNHAAATGRSVAHADALVALQDNREWHDAVVFVRSL
jgi:hypothetical protein